jgi:transposase
MFIKQTKTREKDGASYYTFRLVENYRGADQKVKSETLFNLGANYPYDKEQRSIISHRVQSILRHQAMLIDIDPALETESKRIANLVIKKYGKEIYIDEKNEPIYESIDPATLENSNVRTVGAEHAVYQTAVKIGLPAIFKDCGFNDKEVNIATATIAAKVLAPASDFATSDYLKNDSGLDEVMGTNFGGINKNHLYNISDKILKNKDKIESALYEKEKNIFQFDDVITLYDLTNTYFEGRSKKSDYAQFGRSKEKRNDCPIVTLALVLSGSGFPKKSKIFHGNVSEPKTLKEMLDELTDKKCTVVMDAGIATEENIKYLVDEGYKYILVSREREQKFPKDVTPVVVKETKDNKVTAVLVTSEDSEEKKLYCHSEDKQKKEEAMSEKSTERFEVALKNIVAGLSRKGGVKKLDLVNQRIGRIKEKFKGIARLYDIKVESDEKNKIATNITWKYYPERKKKEDGVYCLRTNQSFDEKELWRTYTTITNVEDAFRCMKTDLAMRPVYHQTDNRIAGHLFITVLAYHVLHAMRTMMKNACLDFSWKSAMKHLKRHFRLTTSMKCRDGKTMHIRKTMRASITQLSIYKALGIISRPINAIMSKF